MNKRKEPNSEEIKELKDKNARLEYRIKHLLRALDEQDKELEEKDKQI